MVASNIFYWHPYLGKWSNLTNIFQVGWFNHQPEYLQVDGKQKRFQKPHALQLHLATATSQVMLINWTCDESFCLELLPGVGVVTWNTQFCWDAFVERVGGSSYTTKFLRSSNRAMFFLSLGRWSCRKSIPDKCPSGDAFTFRTWKPYSIFRTIGWVPVKF